jgi:hypothetical protein
VNETLAQRLVETDLMDILFAIHDVKDVALINDKVRLNFSLKNFLRNSFCFSSSESTNRLGNRSTMFEIQIDSTEQRSTDSFLSKQTHLHSFLIILFIKINNP